MSVRLEGTSTVRSSSQGSREEPEVRISRLLVEKALPCLRGERNIQKQTWGSG
jgi:hypothetical protein